ncbi:MAG: hypothetical protein J5826_00795 [Bacteroidales bacterium]|nr:hypothetical protein [Bacteroidales bacterium]
METNSRYTPLCDMFGAVSTKEPVEVRIQQKIVKSGFRYVTFVKNTEELASAVSLNRIAPNIIYPEKAYIAAKGGLSALFSFGNKATKDLPDVLGDGLSLANGLVLKSAPAYRVNYSRLWISLARTIKANGGKVTFDQKATPEVGSMPVTILESPLRYSPVKKSLMIPFDDAEIWLMNRGNTFYIIAINISEPHVIVESVNKTIPKASVYLKNFERTTLLNINNIDFPFEAFNKTPIAPNTKLDGCNFEFSPSAPDVIGFADTKFDEVKRMDVNVNVFKNAVFDFGTHIDTIIERTYDLFPEYRNGAKAFDAAVKEFADSEL